MRSYKLTTVFALLAIMLGFTPISHAQTNTGETTAADVRQEAVELVQTLKDYSAEQRDEALQTATDAMDKLDKRIDTLETRIDDNWDQMDKAAREKARKSLRALRGQRTELAEWYGGWKQSSANAWEDMKEGFSDAYQALSDAWEQAEGEFSDK